MAGHARLGTPRRGGRSRWPPRSRSPPSWVPAGVGRGYEDCPRLLPRDGSDRERRRGERTIGRRSARASCHLVARRCASRRGWLGAPWQRARARSTAHGGVQATREPRSVASGRVRKGSEGGRERGARNAGPCCYLTDGPYDPARQLGAVFRGAIGVQKAANCRKPEKSAARATAHFSMVRCILPLPKSSFLHFHPQHHGSGGGDRSIAHAHQPGGRRSHKAA